MSRDVSQDVIALIEVDNKIVEKFRRFFRESARFYARLAYRNRDPVAKRRMARAAATMHQAAIGAGMNEVERRYTDELMPARAPQTINDILQSGSRIPL